MVVILPDSYGRNHYLVQTQMVAYVNHGGKNFILQHFSAMRAYLSENILQPTV